MTINPADLNDPVKAEAFLRETIDDLTAEIGQMEISTAEQIRSFREQHGDDPDAVLKFTRRMQARRELQTGNMRQRRDELIKTFATIESMSPIAPIILDEGFHRTSSARS